MSCMPFSVAPTSEDRAQDHVEDFLHRALVEDQHVQAALGQIARDVGLQVGEADDQVGLQLQDFFLLCTQKRRDARLLLPRARRPHGVARDADDAPLLAEEVQRLGAFLGQADDALGKTRRHGRKL